MKKLGNLVLPDSLQWPDRYEFTAIQQSVVRTLSGEQVVFNAQLIGGRPVTLVAEDQVTWIEQGILDELFAMVQQMGAVFNLIWDEETLQVMFMHQSPPVIKMSPIFPHYNQYVGSVKLMVVS